MDPERLDRARDVLNRAGPVAALTGAGISAECGIPPFRGPGGLWDRFPPEEYATIQAFRRDPQKVWLMLREILRAGIQVEPGEGHRALAAMESRGRLCGVITQNVDGLHQVAGNRRVAELHGCGRELLCVTCGLRVDGAKVDLSELPPRCETCEGVLRPDVVLFGEMLSEDVVQLADRISEDCKALLVIGTSCEVYPAALYPDVAMRRGVPVIEINPSRTALTGRADLSLRGTAAEVLPRLLA